MTRPVALVVGPWRHATPEDHERRHQVTRDLLAAGWCPVFLPPCLAPYLDDEDHEQRRVALECSEAFVRCVARDPEAVMVVVVVGVGSHPSHGMARDLRAWQDAGRGDVVFTRGDWASALAAMRPRLTGEAL